MRDRLGDILSKARAYREEIISSFTAALKRQDELIAEAEELLRKVDKGA
jgi:hypothetical protein